jgi:hypothetical protein
LTHRRIALERNPDRVGRLVLLGPLRARLAQDGWPRGLTGGEALSADRDKGVSDDGCPLHPIALKEGSQVLSPVLSGGISCQRTAAATFEVEANRALPGAQCFNERLVRDSMS